MNLFLKRLALVSGLPALLTALNAQTTLSYSVGETNASALVLSGANTPLTLQVDTGTATQSGNISESGGAFGFTKDGAGTLILSGSNSYTGNTAVAAGTLQIGTTGALGTGTVYLGATATLQLTGGTHTIAGLLYNTNYDEPGPNPFLVVSGGAVLNNTGTINANYDSIPSLGLVVTGTGSRVSASSFAGSTSVTLANGGTLQFTSALSSVQLNSLNIGAAVGETAAAPGYLAVSPSGSTSGFADLIHLNHTATDYWFTSDGTATGTGINLLGDYRVSAGTTIFKGNNANTGGSLQVDGGEIRFTAPVQGSFYAMTINAGGTASFSANPFRALSFTFALNGGTLRAMDNFTIATDPTDHVLTSAGGTLEVDAGKTLTITGLTTVPDYTERGQVLKGPYTYTKTGSGTLSVDRGFTGLPEAPPDFVVRQGTLRTYDYLFDEMVVGKFSGDDGHFTLSGTNPGMAWHGGVLTSLGFLWTNNWTPAAGPNNLMVEVDTNGIIGTSDYFIPVAQSRTLMVGEQAGSTGHLNLNEGNVGGWWVDNGTAVIGGAGTGHLTLADHFLYNNGHDIIVGQSAGGVGHVTVTGANGQLNAGVDLVSLDVNGVTSFQYPGPPLDHGVGNIIIGQTGVGHVSVTDNARILAGQTFIGAASDLTLGNGGTIFGGFTAQNGGTVHALDGATFAYTLGATTEASHFLAGSTFNVDPGADLIFAFNQTLGFDPGSYTLFTFEDGTTLTGLMTADFLATGLAGYNYTFDLSGTQLNVTISAVPEPSTYALLAGGAGLALAAVRRRKRNTDPK